MTTESKVKPPEKQGLSTREKNRLSALAEENQAARKEKAQATKAPPLTPEQHRLKALVEADRKITQETPVDSFSLNDFADPPALSRYNIPDYLKSYEDRFKFKWVLMKDVENRLREPYYRYHIVNSTSPMGGSIPQWATDRSGAVMVGDGQNKEDTHILMWEPIERHQGRRAAVVKRSKDRLQGASGRAGFEETDTHISQRAIDEGAVRDLPAPGVEAVVPEG